MDEYIGVVVICGDEGTGKTSMALTFPKLLRHFDIDVGGYRRAAWRLPTTEMSSKSYPKPIQIEKLLGTKVTSSRVVVPKRIVGMRELWQEIAQDFVEACQEPAVKTIVLDSATLLWSICHNSYLQELQDKQLAQYKTTNLPFDENNYRERLQPIEYGPANDKMRTIVHTARSYKKNLILVHYPTDEYGMITDNKGNMVEGKTGIKILDGFKETVKLADLVLWTRVKDVEVGGGINKKGTIEKQPIAKITKCGIEGLGLSAVDLEISATFEAIVNLRNTMAGV